MAYPREKTHLEYLQYVERVANGEEDGPQLSKEEWMKRQQQDTAASKADLKIGQRSQGRSGLQIGGQ